MSTVKWLRSTERVLDALKVLEQWMSIAPNREAFETEIEAMLTVLIGDQPTPGNLLALSVLLLALDLPLDWDTPKMGEHMRLALLETENLSRSSFARRRILISISKTWRESIIQRQKMSSPNEDPMDGKGDWYPR